MKSNFEFFILLITSLISELSMLIESHICFISSLFSFNSYFFASTYDPFNSICVFPKLEYCSLDVCSATFVKNSVQTVLTSSILSSI